MNVIAAVEDARTYCDLIRISIYEVSYNVLLVYF